MPARHTFLASSQSATSISCHGDSGAYVNERRSGLHFQVCLRSRTQRPLGIRHRRLPVIAAALRRLLLVQLMYCLIPFSGISGARSTYFFGLALAKCRFKIVPWGFRSLRQRAEVKTPLPGALEISDSMPAWNPSSLTPVIAATLRRLLLVQLVYCLVPFSGISEFSTITNLSVTLWKSVMEQLWKFKESCDQ